MTGIGHFVLEWLYYGSSKPCSCTPYDIAKYQRKLSGPVLDRIDMHVTVNEIDHTKLLGGSQATESSTEVSKRVRAARQRQLLRYNDPRITNAGLTNKLLRRYAALTPEAKQLLDQAALRLNLSARSYMRTIKVARTIADLNAQDSIGLPEITEALQYLPSAQP